MTTTQDPTHNVAVLSHHDLVRRVTELERINGELLQGLYLAQMQFEIGITHKINHQHWSDELKAIIAKAKP